MKEGQDVSVMAIEVSKAANGLSRDNPPKMILNVEEVLRQLGISAARWKEYQERSF